jgi:hypothetical protein
MIYVEQVLLARVLLCRDNAGMGLQHIEEEMAGDGCVFDWSSSSYYY